MLAAVVPPFTFRFDLVFDGRLDVNKIEDVTRDGGEITTQPKGMPPVSVTWNDMPAGFKLTVGSNGLPLTAVIMGSSSVFGRASPSFPSGATLTFHLDRDGLTSRYNEPMEGPDTITVVTEPFQLKIQGPPRCEDGAEATVLTDFQLPLVFNNRPIESSAALASFIHVTLGGTAVPFRLLSEPRSLPTLLVAPAQDPGQWPAGVTIQVFVDAELPDVFGATLGAPVGSSFAILSNPPGASSGCASPPGVGADAGVEPRWPVLPRYQVGRATGDAHADADDGSEPC